MKEIQHSSVYRRDSVYVGGSNRIRVAMTGDLKRSGRSGGRINSEIIQLPRVYRRDSVYVGGSNRIKVAMTGDLKRSGRSSRRIISERKSKSECVQAR